MDKMITKEIKPVLPKQIGTEEGKLLFQKSGEVKNFDEAKRIVSYLKATIYHYGGVGLAAPQIGIPKRVFIVNIKPSERRPNIKEVGFVAYVNPRILSLSSETNKDIEGCLSVFYATLYGGVGRANSLKIEYFDPEGKKHLGEITDPFHARVVQHEYDHLNGVVFLQRMDKEDFAGILWDERLDIRGKD